MAHTMIALSLGCLRAMKLAALVAGTALLISCATERSLYVLPASTAATAVMHANLASGSANYSAHLSLRSGPAVCQRTIFGASGIRFPADTLINSIQRPANQRRVLPAGVPLQFVYTKFAVNTLCSVHFQATLSPGLEYEFFPGSVFGKGIFGEEQVIGCKASVFLKQGDGELTLVPLPVPSIREVCGDDANVLTDFVDGRRGRN